MTNREWSPTFTARVAEQMRRARKAAGLTVTEAAEACAALGLAVPKTTITNLETGRRSSIDLAEFLVLAEVYKVPPVSLLFPLGLEASVEVLPDREVSTWDAVAWFTGETRLERPAPEDSARGVLDTFRAHCDAVATALASTRLAKERRRKASTTLGSGRREALLEAAGAYEQLAFDDCRELREFRLTMQQRGLTPPSLPTELSFVDEHDPED
ncbi:helix-turn-helix domain-containing protein [Streptomyces sp. Je 1-4]|uniref:helix-turn-helix domain-containing protein n=1 Tax=Streptomyces TaxID=1883 RepID=UPI0021DAFB50|nr:MULTISPECIES: helix-turn-helix transcriptional regulator [unclassified Streptomyces]UYB40945.1 helix-turn-helix domain-containing protein [Streptomyces sp. Je 1-4]UZQ37105.1 helix-turn-helix domain-containing protein [Streptomyces sp. Je 1-4] [Streptomyces sp. Je 1-4 4N24]UZQ44522.1 helix-turn-helix domain-containing protein [Streptomyces sp. Je 1-4] [Streptomyces sp. Je 1-4 4N24_ara]